MKSIDIKKLINGFPTIKKVVYHSFLTILLGVTISVCSSVKEEKSDDNTAVASSQSSGVEITDGSDQKYMRIGDMQFAWGSTTSSSDVFSTHNFPITFSEAPLVTATVTNQNISSDDTVTVYSVSKTGVTLGLRNGRTANFIAMGKWQ